MGFGRVPATGGHSRNLFHPDISAEQGDRRLDDSPDQLARVARSVGVFTCDECRPNLLRPVFYYDCEPDVVRLSAQSAKSNRR